MNDKDTHKHNPEETNNLKSADWGPSGWIFLHSVSFGYPDQPTQQDKDHYKSFFENISHVLPCSACRDSYKKHIASGSCQITDTIFESNRTLTEWLYNLHNKVNEHLQVTFNLTYDDLVARYDNFRIDCKKCTGVLPNDPNYKIIPMMVAQKFHEYAKLRKLDFFEENLQLSQNSSPDQVKIRNQQITELLKLNTPLIEPESSPYTGLPTEYFLKLISLLYSPICVSSLQDMYCTLDELYKTASTSASTIIGSGRKYKLVNIKL